MKKYISILDKIFPPDYLLIDSTYDIFELNLAFMEFEGLSESDLINRSAYFKSINGKETTHFKTCNLQRFEETHKNSSFRTKAFFLNGKYSTGYATHSLFPYRGKFHPQLIRGLLNILNINKGDMILDPMAGSSTLSVEASLLGLDSISVDLSPFCCLMGRVKTFALDLNIEYLDLIVKRTGQTLKNAADSWTDEEKRYYEIILLAYLDAMGYAKRTNYSLDSLFPRVLERYISTIKFFNIAREQLNLTIGKSFIYEGNAFDLKLDDNSVDAILTSPPYSFAIDYLKNDQTQLEYMGCNLESLRREMIGLQGRGVEDRLNIYFEKISGTLSEMRRVSKKNSPIVIIIGTNDIQTKGVRLESRLIELAEKNNIRLEHSLHKPIRGLQNTMRYETILFFINDK